NGTDLGQSITTDTMGHIYSTGSFNSNTAYFGNDTLIVQGYNDIYILKLNSNGQVVCAKSMGGNSNDIGKSITTDASGNIYSTGSFYSDTAYFGNNKLISQGNYDVFILKQDSNGQVIWAKSMGGNDIDQGYSITSDAIGNIYSTGYFYSNTAYFGNDTLLSQ